MQGLELAYNRTKDKVYSEEEYLYLLCRLAYHCLESEEVFEKIKRDICEFPVFRFDCSLESRTPQEFGRRWATLFTMISEENAGAGSAVNDDGEEAPAPAPARGSPTSSATSAASSATTPAAPGKRAAKKKWLGLDGELTATWARLEKHYYSLREEWLCTKDLLLLDRDLIRVEPSSPLKRLGSAE